MKRIRFLVLLISLLVIPWAYTQAQGIITEIDLHALKLMMKIDPNILIIDVRLHDLVKRSPTRIKKCINIPLEKLKKEPTILDKLNGTLVFVGGTEHEARTAGVLASQKKAHVYVFKGEVHSLEKILGPKPSTEKGSKKLLGPEPQKEPLPLEPVEPGKGAEVGEEDFGC